VEFLGNSTENNPDMYVRNVTITTKTCAVKPIFAPPGYQTLDVNAKINNKHEIKIESKNPHANTVATSTRAEAVLLTESNAHFA
ncbi:hypothetical protein QZH41_017933, partial [Actinostola sp. cb2023]